MFDPTLFGVDYKASQAIETHLKNTTALYQELLKRVGIDPKLTSRIIDLAKKKPKHIVFAEADHPKILKGASLSKIRLQNSGITCSKPILGPKIL